MYKLFKRFFDLLLSLILIIICSPFMLIIAIIIKLDSKGSIIFKQQRLGKNGKIFNILKFRTMVNNAEKQGTKLDSYENDPRVTKFGKFLRKTSLDELPQLFNIIIGTMSFVGPRPPVTYHPYEYDDYPMEPKKRFNVKPGITGHAQINGRNELSWDEKFKYDLDYISKANLWFDFKIMILTVFKVLKMDGSFDKVDKKDKFKKEIKNGQ